MDAHGGWIATARDLVRLLTAVDGFPSRPDILSAATIQTMTTPSANNINYAKGWQVNSAGNWWHGGSLHGSYSWMVRTNGQVYLGGDHEQTHRMLPVFRMPWLILVLGVA